MEPRSVFALFPTIALACAMIGCTATSPSSSTSAPPAPAPPASASPGQGDGEPDLAVCAPDAVRYHAFLKQGACANVRATNGTWFARSLFPEAPAEIRDAACTYQWSASASASASGSAAPDVEALERIGADFLTKSAEKRGTALQCIAGTLAPGALTQLPSDDGGPSAPTGVSGCDVCGRLLGRRVFVILPADKLNLRKLVVSTSAGQFLTFEVSAPDAATQAFSAELPPAIYTQGRIILEAAF